MLGGKHNTNPRVPPHLRAEGSEVINPASLPKSHISAGKHRDTLAKPQHDFRDKLSNEPCALVIPAIIGGVRGAIVARFIDFRNLHNGPTSGKDAQDNAA